MGALFELIRKARGSYLLSTPKSMAARDHPDLEKCKPSCSTVRQQLTPSKTGQQPIAKYAIANTCSQQRPDRTAPPSLLFGETPRKIAKLPANATNLHVLASV